MDNIVEWEYESSANYSPEPTIKTLNSFGAEGWELVSIIEASDGVGWILYFKRPKLKEH